MPNNSVAVIIPAYNEGSVITEVIEGIHESLKDYPHSVVVVDDGSKDDTKPKARQAGAHVIPHIINSGSGGATSTGLAYAARSGFTYAATIDADGQHDPDDLKKVIDRLHDTDAPDLVIGSRLIDNQGMSNVKVLGNKGLSFFTYLLFGISVTDSQSGLRGLSRNALSQLNLRTQGYEFCSEMLWRAKQKKLKITEVPIKAIYTDYSMAKGQNNWNAFMIIQSLLQRRIMELFGE